MELRGRIFKIGEMIETLIHKTVSPSWSLKSNWGNACEFECQLSKIPSVFGLDDIEDSRMVDYIVYQVYRLRNVLNNSCAPVSWLFSLNAINKYKKQFFSPDGKAGINYYIDIWLNNAGLSRDKLIKMIAVKKESRLKSMVFMEAEEPFKQRFFNTPEGFPFCQSFTTGWSPLSPSCNVCDYRKKCEETTAKKYPELVRHRKETINGKEK